MAVSYIGDGTGSSKENAITIENFADFRQVNNSNNINKYVKLLNDINVSEEEWYRGSVEGWGAESQSATYANNIWCMFFADADSPKTISGLTIVNPYGFLCGPSGSGNAYGCFENINIIDCCYKSSSTGTAVNIFGGTSYTTKIRFINCNISVFVVDNTYQMNLFSTNINSYITDSTIYIKHKLNNALSVFQMLANTNVTRSTIIVDGFNIRPSSTQSSGSDASAYCLFRNTGKKISSCLIFRNCNFKSFKDPNNTRSWLLCQSSEGLTTELQSYYAFDNCTFEDGLPLPVFGSVTSRLVACNSQTQAFTHETFSSNTDATIFATMVDSTDPNFNTSSIKSQQYLIDSGFLP